MIAYWIIIQRLEGNYDGICRLELNLTSKQQIREALSLTGNTLAEVLQSEKNPIQDFLAEVLAEDPAGKSISDWKSYQKYAVLALCGYDLTKVEATIRRFKDPRSTSIPKMMAPYREILAGTSAGNSTWSKQRLLNAVK